MTKAEVAEFGENPIHDYNFMIQTMQRLDQPVIASVQGGAAGAAMGFIGACDLVIASEQATFSDPHCPGFAVPPGDGGARSRPTESSTGTAGRDYEMPERHPG